VRRSSDSELTEAFASELENELLGQAWRLEIAAQNRQLIETITARALSGAAGPPGLDELLAMDIGEETAFARPRGRGVPGAAVGPLLVSVFPEGIGQGRAPTGWPRRAAAPTMISIRRWRVRSSTSTSARLLASAVMCR